MTNKEYAASLLIEAAELLDESAARDQRKDIHNNINSLRKNNNFNLYLKGKLSNNDAENLYKALKKEIKILYTEIDKIPNDTNSEKVFHILKGSGLSILVSIASTVVSYNVWHDKELTSVCAGLLGIIFGIGLDRTTQKDTTYNKDLAKSKLNQFEKKIEKIYTKYYKKSQNECVAELLIEAAELLNEGAVKIVGFEYTPMDDDETISNEEITKANKNISNILKTGCKLIMEEEKSTGMWTDDYLKKHNIKSVEDAFSVKNIVDKTFYINNDKIELVISFKWYRDMMYGIKVKNGEVVDTLCIGD